MRRCGRWRAGGVRVPVARRAGPHRVEGFGVASAPASPASRWQGPRATRWVDVAGEARPRKKCSARQRSGMTPVTSGSRRRPAGSRESDRRSASAQPRPRRGIVPGHTPARLRSRVHLHGAELGCVPVAVSRRSRVTTHVEAEPPLNDANMSCRRGDDGSTVGPELDRRSLGRWTSPRGRVQEQLAVGGCPRQLDGRPTHPAIRPRLEEVARTDRPTDAVTVTPPSVADRLSRSGASPWRSSASRSAVSASNSRSMRSAASCARPARAWPPDGLVQLRAETDAALDGHDPTLAVISSMRTWRSAQAWR